MNTHLAPYLASPNSIGTPVRTNTVYTRGNHYGQPVAAIVATTVASCIHGTSPYSNPDQLNDCQCQSSHVLYKKLPTIILNFSQFS